MPTPCQWFIGEFVPAVSRTLLHSLWQGLLAALIAGIIILCTRKTAATTRYNALLFLFALLLSSVAVTFMIELQSSTPSEAVPLIVVAPAPVSLSEFASSNEASPNFIGSILSFVDRYAVLLVSTWFFLFAFQLSRLAFGLREISKIRKHKTSVPGQDWATWMHEKSKQLGINQSVVLLQSALAKVPIAIGYFKPVVLVPVGLLTQLTAAQVETILLHELAHIKRRDYVVNLFQSLVDAIFFFNPGFVWLSSLIRQEREKCCDDIVIHQTTNQHSYLEALVCFQDMNLTSGYAMALGTKKYYLLNRVKRILTRENSRLSIKEAATLVIGVIMFGIAFMAFKPIVPAATTQNAEESEGIIHKAQPIVSAPTYFADTVPQKAKEAGERPIRFKKIISNIVDDGGNNTLQIQATEENGTVYKLRKQGNETTEFSVNEKQVPKAEFHKYATIMDAIERAKNKQMKHALTDHHDLHFDFEPFMDTLDLKFDLHLENNFLFNDSSWQQEHLFNHDENHEFVLNLEMDNSFSQNPTVALIITDLLANKLIQSEDKISFSLTNSELIVNGKTQSKSMHEKFKSKYIKHPADRYKYSKQGKSTMTEIYVE